MNISVIVLNLGLQNLDLILDLDFTVKLNLDLLLTDLSLALDLLLKTLKLDLDLFLKDLMWLFPINA